MFGESKNLKDSSTNLGLTLKDNPLPISYTKTHKLITALYMVTDVMDKDEPLRNKLRTLGAGIISDTYYIPMNACGKISEIMSFLDIASAVNIVSQMNCNILQKEFSELDQSIKRWSGAKETPNKHVNLSEFLREELPAPSGEQMSLNKGQQNLKGHMSIGLQKGSTLMKALNKVVVSDKNINTAKIENFDMLKKQRRDAITNIIKTIGDSATIKDIKDKIDMMPGEAGLLASSSEKTLQRELVSMVKDGVLNKTGEKRWSRYFLK